MNMESVQYILTVYSICPMDIISELFRLVGKNQTVEFQIVQQQFSFFSIILTKQ